MLPSILKSLIPRAEKRLGEMVLSIAPRTITYSFIESLPSYMGARVNDGFPSVIHFFDETERSLLRHAFSVLESLLMVDFVEIDESAGDSGQIRIGGNAQYSSLGLSWMPGSTGDDREGDIWLNMASPWMREKEMGGYFYSTFLHELGHAMGLKHPGSYGSVGDFMGSGDEFLAPWLDNTRYTVMSYNELDEMQRIDFGVFDVAALRYLYGARNFNPDDDVYFFDETIGARLISLVDDGGFDILDFGLFSSGIRLSLNAGELSSVGVNRNGGRTEGNLAIAWGTDIEGVVASIGDDVIFGGNNDNYVYLSLGDNFFDGGGGLNRAYYQSRFDAYSVDCEFNPDLILVRGEDVFDTLVNTQILIFGDAVLAFEFTDALWKASATLVTWYGREALVRSPELLGYGVRWFDSGASLDDLVSLVLNHRFPEGVSDANLFQDLYTNVTGIAPDSNSIEKFHPQAEHRFLDDYGIYLTGLAWGSEEIRKMLGDIGIDANGLMYI